MAAALVIMPENTALSSETAEECVTMAGADCLTMPLSRMIETAEDTTGEQISVPYICPHIIQSDSHPNASRYR